MVGWGGGGHLRCCKESTWVWGAFLRENFYSIWRLSNPHKKEPTERRDSQVPRIISEMVWKEGVHMCSWRENLVH